MLLGAWSASCTDMVPTREHRTVDSLNELAHSYRYRTIDSLSHYAWLAYEEAMFYKAGKAEAVNFLAMYAFQRMEYAQVLERYKEVYRLTPNELELLIADIGMMKYCQRTSRNREFYDYKNKAQRRLKRIDEDRDLFTDRHESQRLKQAVADFYLTSASYYYYLGQMDEVRHLLSGLSSLHLETDRGLWLYARYMQAMAEEAVSTSSGGERIRRFDHLYALWQDASSEGYPYWEANALQGMAGVMALPTDEAWVRRHRAHLLYADGARIDSLQPLRMAHRALQLFKQCGETYQIVGAYLTIGKCLNMRGEYRQAIDSLERAKACADSIDSRLPEWSARINEQLSVSYAGLGMKDSSDIYRNAYLDRLNESRQDKELESRYKELEQQSRHIDRLLLALCMGMVALVFLFYLLHRRAKMSNESEVQRLRRLLDLCVDITSSVPLNVPVVSQGLERIFGMGRVELRQTADGYSLVPMADLRREELTLLSLLQPYVEWVNDNARRGEDLSETRLMLEKQRHVYEQHILCGKRENIVKKACLSIVNGINPFIDRILNEVHKLRQGYAHSSATIRHERYEYIDELVDTINESNDMLASWIKMKQGSLSLNIENFALDELFTLVGKNRRSFEQRRQQLSIVPTSSWVKADRALTLFMINTLAENARKYTPVGGHIRVEATPGEDYVEVAVSDDGVGLSQEDVERILGEKVYDSAIIGMANSADPEGLKAAKGGGFGLMNCKGIIEKYRKTSSLFRVCTFGIESRPGKGSRFFFRLPLGQERSRTGRMGGWMLLLLGTLSLQAAPMNRELRADTSADVLLEQASQWADSAYYANLDRRPGDVLRYAERAVALLNKDYMYRANSGRLNYIQLHGVGLPAEQEWWKDGFETDYHIILDLRNEVAVACLALNNWQAYTYNNQAFTELYKLQSEDRTLESFCQRLERSNTNRRVGIGLAIVLFLLALASYYLFYLRKRVKHRLRLEQMLEINETLFAASQNHRIIDAAEALQYEEDIYKEIPLRMIVRAFEGINELLITDALGLAVYNRSSRGLNYVSTPSGEQPPIVQACFEAQTYLHMDGWQAMPLLIEAESEKSCVGVFCLQRPTGTERETDRLWVELMARYVAIVVRNTVLTPATQFRDIEAAHEEAHRASWEDGLLHVQNMVLDNCLSTIKHETIYYPNKIKQIIGKLLRSEGNEHEHIEAVGELIEYYKGMYTILSSCAARQLEDVTFRRSTIEVGRLMHEAERFFHKTVRNRLLEGVSLEVDSEASLKVVGDVHQLTFLLETLLGEALSHRLPGKLSLSVRPDGDFAAFVFTDSRRQLTEEEMHTLFYSNSVAMKRARLEEQDEGTAFLICKQIMREHDEYAGRRGCRILAQAAPQGGFCIRFTLPMR